MWFLKSRIPRKQIEARLFEFKGAVQTCHPDVFKCSLDVLTADLGPAVRNAPWYLEIKQFNRDSVLGGLSKTGTGRRVLYDAFEALMTSHRVDRWVTLENAVGLPHGFSCPRGTRFPANDFRAFWRTAGGLRRNLDDAEVSARLEKFKSFILRRDYDEDALNAMRWHESPLTADLVSGCLFAGESPRLKAWTDFVDASSTMRGLCPEGLSPEQKSVAIARFETLLRTLPVNRFESA